MSADILFLLLILTFIVFIVPKAIKYIFTLIIICSGIILTSTWAFPLLSNNVADTIIASDIPVIKDFIVFSVDRLSAFFIIVINLTVLIGALYASGYLKPYYSVKNSIRFSIHYFSFLWLYFSMILVVIIRDGMFFLIAWEIMALSSFLLVIFDAEDTSVMKTGINYFIQMHVGMFFLLVSFLIVGRETGSAGFDALKTFFAGHSNIPIFILFFIGFGIKAGFVPFHSWLPQAHPAAPSHISGIMSGVMIKMGIYGILRVLINVQNELLPIGVIILVVALLSGLYGVMMAIVQTDIKKLLAYSSIENIGIAGIGIGLGAIGIARGNDTLALLALGGGLLHVFNHSLFKSLLFFNAGSVYRSAHTRNIEQLGGLMKKMPYTSLLFLTGSVAICGLPPFNGFISEYLIYAGMFKSLLSSDLYQSLTLIVSIVGLSLIGGLAIFCFTRVFGIAFLGEARSAKAVEAHEVEKSMILPQVVPVLLIILVGLISPVFVKPVFLTIISGFGLQETSVPVSSFLSDLTGISIIVGIFVLFTLLLILYRKYHLKSRIVSKGPTWGCGYIYPSHRQQYTSTSYAYNYNHLAKPVLNTRKYMEEIREDEIFPSGRSFRSESEDFFKKFLIDKPVDMVSGILKRLAVMQTGRIQHYILYAFVFMLVILILTWLNII